MARGRILGGNSALPGTHPWMVAIYVGELDFCAGTLVSSCWIVSAAHCFFRKYDRVYFVFFDMFCLQLSRSRRRSSIYSLDLFFKGSSDEGVKHQNAVTLTSL